MSESPGTPLERLSKDDEQAGNAVDGGGRGAVYRAWSCELGAIALAVALFITSVILLAHYDRKPPPELPTFLSLNSLIAIFSAMIHAMLLVAVAEGKSIPKAAQVQGRSEGCCQAGYSDMRLPSGYVQPYPRRGGSGFRSSAPSETSKSSTMPAVVSSAHSSCYSSLGSREFGPPHIRWAVEYGLLCRY